MPSLYDRALEFAIKAHENQVRKYTGEPYIEHPIAVANLVERYMVEVTEDHLVAALLHDTIEDCGVTVEEIEYRFNPNVADLVWWLSNPSKKTPNLHRTIRKEMDRKHLGRARTDAQLIKCADIHHNAQSIMTHAPEFAKVWMAEAKALVNTFHPKCSGTALYALASQTIEAYYS